MKKIYVAVVILFLIFLQGCGASPAAITPVPTSAISNVEPLPSPSPTPSGPIPIGTLLDKNLSLQVVHPTGIIISSLAIGANNEVFVIDVEGDTIYQLMENGEFVEHMRFPGKVIDTFNVAPDGTFWFVNKKGWGLYHVVNSRAQLIADHMNRLFDFDSGGNLFAVDQPSGDVQKITPDGSVESIASGFQSQRIGVAPDDRVYIVTFNGELARVEADGSLKIIATGLFTEDSIAFTPDGTMYVMGWNGLMKVDPATETVELVEWYHRYRTIGGELDFDHQGIGYTVHANQPLYRINLETQTLEMIYNPFGNSWAMSVDPLTEEVYVAYGDLLPNGKTGLYRVNAEGGLDEIGSVPYGIGISMTFSKDGIGYLGVTDTGTMESPSMIYRFKPKDGTLDEYQQPACVPQGMAVEPNTGELFWTECNTLVGVGADQGQRSIPYFEGVNSSRIVFAPDGTLFGAIWFTAPVPSQPMQHGIYRYQDGNWTQIKDMTNKDPGLVLTEITVCPDNHIYLAASLPGELFNRDYASMSTIVRLEDDNSLTVIGYDLGGFDPLAVACAPSGSVYFTNGHGIYSIPGLGAAP